MEFMKTKSLLTMQQGGKLHQRTVIVTEFLYDLSLQFTTSRVLFGVCIIYCTTCQLLKNLFRGFSSFCLRVFKATHIYKFRRHSQAQVRRPFDYKTGSDHNNCALPLYCCLHAYEIRIMAMKWLRMISVSLRAAQKTLSLFHELKYTHTHTQTHTPHTHTHRHTHTHIDTEHAYLI